MKPVILKTIYLIRHGQSEDNAAPSAVFYSTASPLTERGIKQANAVADRIATLKFDTLISSSVLRAKQTAEIIAQKTGKQPEYSELFVERMKPKIVEGKPHTDEEARKLFEEWEKSLFSDNYKVEDSENFADIIARADKALAFLKHRPEESLVVVTHGFFMRTIVARVLLGDALTSAAFKNLHKSTAAKNTGITVLQYRANVPEDKAWQLWIYNDHAHLAD